MKLKHRLVVWYYWYDHGELRKTGEAEQVIEAIRSKDLETFMKFFNKYGAEYFPEEAYVWDPVSKTRTIEPVDITKHKGFDAITHVQYREGFSEVDETPVVIDLRDARGTNNSRPL